MKKVVAERSAHGAIHMKVLLRGNVGTEPLSIVPPTRAARAASCEEHAVAVPPPATSSGDAAGGTVKRDDAHRWRVVNANSASCPVLPTTTTTTTTTTLPPMCGNNVIDAGELCDGSAGGICAQNPRGRGAVTDPPPPRAAACWQGLLPCTPYPDPALRLRRDGDLRAGVMLDPVLRARYRYDPGRAFLRK